LPLIPPFDDYYEPFVGGGAVFFSIQSQRKFINDKSSELYNLYKMVARQDKEFFCAFDILLRGWQRVSEIIAQRALYLINLYKAYSLGECSSEEIELKLLEFIQHHSEEFKEMFEVFFDKDTENFVQELKRNLISKTRRMKILEGKKWRLPENDIIENLESAFYMHLVLLLRSSSLFERMLTRQCSGITIEENSTFLTEAYHTTERV
jgi:DNA adenine methylase